LRQAGGYFLQDLYAGIPILFCVIQGAPLMDLVFLGLTAVFFALSVGLVLACERLRK